MKNYWTQKECNAIIERYKNETAYFGNTINGEPLKFSELYEMFRLRYGFGEPETNIILASLIKAGAKIVK